jgi:aminopeptidase N
MGAEKPQAVHRLDYRPPDYRIDAVHLDFDLREDGTRVRARIEMHRAPVSVGDVPPLVLDGEELETLSVAIDGEPLAANAYEVREGALEIHTPPERFVLETEVRIHPERNTALSGLYKSGGNFCTQCEAHGFRRITWFLDRPDVMARFTVRVEADLANYPVLLSNGNRVEEESLAEGRHAVRWEDPFPKPSYLFALVAGDLRSHAGSFTTASGREVRLEIWVEPQNIDRCEHALRSLQRAMRWDEEVFGLEYDLDIYMIVAVGDFNMGAMENKGLNVFNAKYVLALPETATDDEYEAIEAVIGHEYFHNWTGNRVTCRDWFQLTLKEGLTVFRDQQFTADTTSTAVKRIRDVVGLRTSQFAEDAGPMAHPIRPESYISMDNFYTATVYEKGAEVVRLYHTLLGADGFRRGMDLYFERHDGQAVTCDDFRAAMADANGWDLPNFERWYAQAGTPRLEAHGHWDVRTQRYALHLAQSLPDAPEDAPREPLPIPVRMGLLAPDGSELSLRLAGEGTADGTTRVLVLEDAEATFTFEGVPAAPVPSLLRGFSAPVKLAMERGRDELAFLLAHDTDPFSRWDAGQTLAQELLLALANDAREGRALALAPELEAGFGAVLDDAALDGSVRSLMLMLPGLRVLGQAVEPVDYAALLAAREFTVEALARAHRSRFEAIVQSDARGPYRVDKDAIDGRRLRNTALRYLSRLGDTAWIQHVERVFDEADNMTDRQAALEILASLPGAAGAAPLQRFYDRWRNDPLVLDKWFTVQAISTREDTFERVTALAEHPDFTLANPNRARSLVGAFAMGNPARFHADDGRPYAFLADVVLELDGRNPQLAARLVSTFNAWRRFDEAHQALMCAQLERIAGTKPLSKDVFEIVTRALG